MPFDDFDIILGNGFFIQEKVILSPQIGSMLMLDDKQPCYVTRNVVPKVIRVSSVTTT